MMRLLVGGALVGLLLPVLLPAGHLVAHPDGLTAEAGRLLPLAGNTLALAGLAAMVAVPGGTLLALGMERRGALRAGVLVALVVPLPVWAVGWQAVFGDWLPSLAGPGEVAWRPWSVGLLPVAWVHGTAGVPWVAWVVALALRTVDPGLEDAARLAGGEREVWRRVLRPRAAVGAALAGGWVMVTAATEVVVTDAMLVRTFAEEVYTRFVAGGDGLAAAVAVSVPGWLLTAAVAGVALAGGLRRFGHPAEGWSLRGQPHAPRAGYYGWPVFALSAGLPLVALASRCRPPTKLLDVLAADGDTLLVSVGAAHLAGLVAAGLAWPACVLARDSRWFAHLLFAVCVLLAVAPGPVVGFGLKELILRLVTAEGEVLGGRFDFPPLATLLYDQPSPLPGAWAAAVRLFPVAVAVLWPAVRAVPDGLLDAARLDGIGVGKVYGPLTGPAFVRAGLAVAALAVGEVSASKLVQPPAAPSFVLRVFDQMHYGTDSTVAALCLVQVATAAVAGGSLLWAARVDRSPTR